MIIKTFIGLKVLGLTFLGGISVVKVLKECCNKKNENSNHIKIVPKAKKA